MTSKRQMRRRATTAAFWRAKHAAATTPAARERIHRDEWLALLADLDPAERDQHLEAQAQALSEQIQRLRRR